MWGSVGDATSNTHEITNPTWKNKSNLKEREKDTHNYWQKRSVKIHLHNWKRDLVKNTASPKFFIYIYIYFSCNYMLQLQLPFWHQYRNKGFFSELKRKLTHTHTLSGIHIKYITSGCKSPLHIILMDISIYKYVIQFKFIFTIQNWS